MLAYSSIAQAGFMMLAVLALNDMAREGLVLYAAAYSLATIGFFAILIKMNDYTIEGFNGLGKQQPLLALCATIFLLSLTGIPLTAGFQSKFYMLMATAQTGNHLWLVIVAVLFAAISAYYYFRVIQAMYFKEAGTEPLVDDNNISVGFKVLLAITAFLIIAIGIYPELLLGWLYH
jgi:NADH-quinone oxidoreductase subunit N